MGSPTSRNMAEIFVKGPEQEEMTETLFINFVTRFTHDILTVSKNVASEVTPERFTRRNNFQGRKNAHQITFSDYKGSQGHKIWNREEPHRQKHGNGAGTHAIQNETSPQIHVK
jgi:hypothetical protein